MTQSAQARGRRDPARLSFLGFSCAISGRSGFRPASNSFDRTSVIRQFSMVQLSVEKNPMPSDGVRAVKASPYTTGLFRCPTM